MAMIVIVQSFIRVWFFVIPWTAACQASLYITITQSLFKLTSIESVMPSTISSSDSNNNAAAAAAKLLQSCPTLFDPIDSSPPGSPIPGILQARTLEWVAISFSNAEKWKVKVKSLSYVRLLATPWTAAHQGPPSMGFSRQEYWSGCHCLLQVIIANTLIVVSLCLMLLKYFALFTHLVLMIQQWVKYSTLLNSLAKFSVLAKIAGPKCKSKWPHSSMAHLTTRLVSHLRWSHTQWSPLFLLECSPQGLDSLAGCSPLEPVFKGVSEVRGIEKCWAIFNISQHTFFKILEWHNFSTQTDHHRKASRKVF